MSLDGSSNTKRPINKFLVIPLWICGAIAIDLVNGISLVLKGSGFHMCTLCLCTACTSFYIWTGATGLVFFLFAWAGDWWSRQVRKYK